MYRWGPTRRGQAPALRGGTNQFYPFGVVHTSGGTHRSRPTNHPGSPSDDFRCVPVMPGFMVRCTVVRRTGRCRHRPLQGVCISRTIPSGGGKPPPYGVQPISFIHLVWCIPAAGHIGSALREHTEPDSGGAEGPLALSPQQCEAWIEGAAALFPAHRTKSLKNLKIPKLKSFTRFFSKNRRGPGGGAPGRPSQRAKHPLSELRTTKPGWCRACHRRHRRRGGFQCGFWRPWGRRRKIPRWR